ncbi:hypothetical protein [Paraflavitalea speifideaquila]|uniref:hypothetical protein n=1 Tax=Paraflavitalea speifideaquila TaxID=3076558 RepID=UPI0028E6DD9A|nr:hypothetical protein [Paraflavitalea speifideiaquila]
MLRITLLWLAVISSMQLRAQSPQDMVKKNLDDLKIVIPGIGKEPGLGQNEGIPEGTPFKLPRGMRFVQRPNKAFDPNPKLLLGNANTFYADVNIEINRDSVQVGAPTFITFEPALVMLSAASSRYQNGMFMDRIRITIPPTGIGPGGLRDTITVYIGLVCLNKSLAMPWEENIQDTDDVKDYPIGKGKYMPAVITNHKGLQQLAALLAQYPKLKLTKHWNPQQMYQDGYEEAPWNKIYSRIQEMVWKVTDGPGITKGELASFKEELAPYK